METNSPVGGFPSTFWSTLKGEQDRAREQVFTRYRTPIFRYIVRRGFSEADADDLTQEVFARVCREEFLSRADREKGRFRSLLLAVTRNVIHEERRRRRRHKALPLEESIAVPDEAAGSEIAGEDETLNLLWAQHLVERAMERLRAESASGGPRHYDAFVLNKVQELSYQQVAEKLGASLTDVTNWIHHAREKIRRHLLEEIRVYSSTEGEYEDEVRKLTSLLQ